MNQDKIGKFMKICRTEKGMTQVQFAEKLGVTNKSVSKWETGKCLPDASLFHDICLLLDISINELFAGERITAEHLEKKSEENLMNVVTEYQKRDSLAAFCTAITFLVTLFCLTVNMSVGGLQFQGAPVMGNTVLTVLCILSWGIFSIHTKAHFSLQKIAFAASALVLISSAAAFAFQFWDVNTTASTVVGYPAMSLFYGMTIALKELTVYLLAAVLSLVNLLYLKNNMGKLNNK